MCGTHAEGGFAILLLYLVDVVADDAVQTELLVTERGKAMASELHAVLSPMSGCVVHDILYTASLPYQSKMSTPVEDSAKGRRKRLPPGLVV